ncbi:Adenosine deaminase 2 [Holothuria leucospilota]|uniref:adenosine deaminase n=1 Tax=Holothuria leucospilota TaxID=206669 RepID=A0A9Q0YQN5_HOLLE|nr:Adenosine deaminase 2 [Holothuria leucospilota]
MEKTSSTFNIKRHCNGTKISRWCIFVSLCFLANFFSRVKSMPLCGDKSCIIKTSRNLLDEENSISIGQGVKLDDLELHIDSTILAPMKASELRNYDELLSYEDVPDNSYVYHFIRKMPKGGDLHIHELSMVNIAWVVSELTYLPDLYYCDTRDGKFVRYRYSDQIPSKEHFCNDSWISVTERRKEMGVTDFDKMLYDKMTLEYKRQGAKMAWEKFIGAIACVLDLIYSEVGFRPYFKQALTEVYEDNVLYVEVRAEMLPILRKNGKSYPREETLRWFMKATKEFKEANPGFIGAKFILISVRSKAKEAVESDIKTAMALHQKYPSHLIGYDIAGYENNGRPLNEFLDILFIPSQNGLSLPFFFHAGETKRFGDTDENILFAILLNTTRIGHGFALIKHPLLMDMVKQRNIVIEVNPISNQVLNLVSDMRNHPGVVFFSNGLPVVICSDDPAPWKTSGLSYDYHAAFMAFTREKDGLEVLKEMSRNGIKYSTMSEDEKKNAFNTWEQKWDEFITSFQESETFASAKNLQRLDHEDL